MKKIVATEQQLIGTAIDSFENLAIAKAFGSTLVDENGKKYIDFTSSWNVMNLGWHRPEIINAISKQLVKFPCVPLWCASKPTIVLARELRSLLPESLDTFFKATGGTEANEIALKIARAYTGKRKIFSFYGEYHGQTLGSISLGNSAKSTNPFEPLVPGFVRVEAPYSYRSSFGRDLDDPELTTRYLEIIRKTIELEGDPAAFFCEAILTCPGVVIPPKEFFRELRKICDEFKMLLIIDEVGTGFGRTGKMFAFEHFHFIPDVVTMAKALSAGYGPIGAVATSRKIADSMSGKGGTSTYGWHTLSAIAAIENLKIIKKENLVQKAEKLGNYILDILKSSLRDIEIVGDIRGMGLEIGIELVKNRDSREPDKEAVLAIINSCTRDGLHLVWSRRTTTLMIMPPLTIDRKILDMGLDILIGNIRNFNKKVGFSKPT